MNIRNYVDQIARAFNTIPYDDLDLAITHIRNNRGKNIWLAGNGGSAATAEHFTCDLLLNGYNAHCLTSNMAALTAFSNDFGYSDALSRMLMRTGNPNDLVIVFSSSGNSQNVFRLADSAKLSGMFVIAFTGRHGGLVSNRADITIKVLSEDTQVVEDVHLLMTHMIYKAIEKEKK